MNSILVWDKPKKVRSSSEHERMHSSDSGIAGTYVPNMSKDAQNAWKARMVGTRVGPLRVEIRKTFSGPDITGKNPWASHAQVLMIVDEHGNYQMSANGTIRMDKTEFGILILAVQEALDAMAAWRGK